MNNAATGKVLCSIVACAIIFSMLGSLPNIVRAAGNFNIGDTVEVTTNLNVRTGPGTSYPEITDPDYPGYAPAGTQGKVLDGPTSADGYIWWKVDYGPGLYSGWSVEGGLEKVVQPPPAPTTTSPGAASEPGAIISDLTPPLQWNAVSGAGVGYYALAISKYPYGSGNIIYNPQQLTGTSHTVPGGTLVAGEKYRWNMQAHNSAGWSAVSNTLYFQTAAADVTLTLYVHEDSVSGPVISGVQVTGQDATSTSFDQTTNASGYVTITGTPGTWSFTVSKSGYNSNSWSQSITSTATKHAYLVKLTEIGHVILTQPLHITPPGPYSVGNTLTAAFTVKNIGDAAITLDKLLLGGRFSGGELSNGGYPDFTYESVTLQPGDTHRYEGTFTIPESGSYDFFIAYYMENPTEAEKEFLDENNWNTSIELGEGLTDADRIRNIATDVDFDFNLSVSPISVEVSRDETISTTVTATLTGGTTQPVSFSVTGLPSGVSANALSFDSPTISRTLTFTVASNAVLGTHTITITATGGSVTQTASYSLTVKELTTLIPGKDVPAEAPDFFPNVLIKLNIPTSKFAEEALEIWTRYENSSAYWNPLATTRTMGIPPEKRSDFNAVGVQNYVDKETGIQATADTLALPYYEFTREMLALQSFNEQDLREAVATWSGLSAGAVYVVNLVNEWERVYPFSTKTNINVNSSPSGAPFRLTGIADYSGTTPWSKTDAPVGTYTVNWGTLSGYQTPAQESKDLIPGGTIGFYGSYEVIPQLITPPGAPILESLRPTLGTSDTEVTVIGKNFSYEKWPTAGSTDPVFSGVLFGQTAATIIEPRTDSKIVVKPPSDLGLGGSQAAELTKYVLMAYSMGTETVAEAALDELVSELLKRFMPNLLKLTVHDDQPVWRQQLQSFIAEMFPGITLKGDGLTVPVRVGTGMNFSNALPFTFRLTDMTPIDIEPSLMAHLASPGELRVYDSVGRVTGLVDGVKKEEIPNSVSAGKTVLILSATDSYRHEVVGTDEGTYGIKLASVRDGKVTSVEVTDVPTSERAVHRYTVDWDALLRGEPSIGVQIDSDGDNTFEQTKIVQPPIASFVFSPTSTLTNEEIDFDASKSRDVDGEVVSYKWNFGDGTTSTGRVVTHTYSAPGEYTVTLAVIDNDGLLSTHSKVIQVEQRQGGLPIWAWTLIGVVVVCVVMIGAWRRASRKQAA